MKKAKSVSWGWLIVNCQIALESVIILQTNEAQDLGNPAH